MRAQFGLLNSCRAIGLTVFPLADAQDQWWVRCRERCGRVSGVLRVRQVRPLCESLRSLSPIGEVLEGGQGVGVVGAQHSQIVRQQLFDRTPLRRWPRPPPVPCGAARSGSRSEALRCSECVLDTRRGWCGSIFF